MSHSPFFVFPNRLQTNQKANWEKLKKQTKNQQNPGDWSICLDLNTWQQELTFDDEKMDRFEEKTLPKFSLEELEDKWCKLSTATISTNNLPRKQINVTEPRTKGSGIELYFQMTLC